jgi:hypothetical protein
MEGWQNDGWPLTTLTETDPRISSQHPSFIPTSALQSPAPLPFLCRPSCPTAHTYGSSMATQQ